MSGWLIGRLVRLCASNRKERLAWERFPGMKEKEK
jgi:hypothetical protein